MRDRVRLHASMVWSLGGRSQGEWQQIGGGCGAQAGLAVIKRKGTVLKCHADMSEMVTLSEIGMSTAILEAGFNLDCLQIRYQARPAPPPPLCCCSQCKR